MRYTENMKFLKQPASEAIPVIADTISKKLNSNQNVLWLVCGGSNIAAQVEIMKLLRTQSSEHLHNLIILPMDERFGEAGHTDSNYRQMRDAGFRAGDATWLDVLARDMPLADTVNYYSKAVQDAFASAGSVIGTFGMGADGHTAGVLPHSPAVAETVATVVGYEAPGFTRMTITPMWLTRCDVSYLLAYGQEKQSALQNLQANALSLDDMPAGLHYDIPDATVYNEAIGKERQT